MSSSPITSRSEGGPKCPGEPGSMGCAPFLKTTQKKAQELTWAASRLSRRGSVDDSEGSQRPPVRSLVGIITTIADRQLAGQGRTASARPPSANEAACALRASLDLKPRAFSVSPDRAPTLGRTPPQAAAGSASGPITSSLRRRFHGHITLSHVLCSPPLPGGAVPAHRDGDHGRHLRVSFSAPPRSRYPDAWRHPRRPWSSRGSAPRRWPCACG